MVILLPFLKYLFMFFLEKKMFKKYIFHKCPFKKKFIFSHNFIYIVNFPCIKNRFM